MSHGKIREDHNCQNCGQQVEHLYCTYCGQENTETRQPFHFLFTHFIEDFVHYDGSFFKTIKTLFLKPGTLTKEYLSGKRNSSVNPVKMYIFVSFVTFFLISIFPSNNRLLKEEVGVENNQNYNSKNNDKAINAIFDTLQNKNIVTPQQSSTIKAEIKKNKEINSLEDVDDGTLEKAQKELNKNHSVLSSVVKKYREIKKDNISTKEMMDIIIEKSLHIIPKVLFIYMPFFAFLLWIFYNKKKWWYFDHGIFTLHYFIVLLLSILIIFLLNKLSNFVDQNAITSILTLINILIILYIIGYFFIALKKIYNQGLIKTFVKGIVILGLNSIVFFLIVLGILFYSFMHV